MKTYLRYLLWQLMLPTLFAFLAFSGAVWLSQSLRFVDLIVNKGLPLSKFLYLSMLLFPSLLPIILPLALFCAVLFAYYRLTMESELIVMQAVGLSNLQLAAPGLVLAAMITVIGYATTLYFMPVTNRNFKDLQYEIQKDYSHVLLQPGVFNTLIPGVTVYVREHRKDGSLGGILVHDEQVPDQPVTWMAEQGQLFRGEDGPILVLESGNRQELTLDGGGRPNLAILHFDSYAHDLAATASPPDQRLRKPRELFLHELLTPGRNMNPQRAREWIAEGHNRLTLPLNAMVFCLIGMTALLSNRFDRRGPWRNVLAAVIGVTVVQALSLAAESLAVGSLAFVPLLYAVPLLPIGLCLWLLAADRLPRRPRWLARRPAPEPA